MRTLAPLTPAEITGLVCPWCGRAPERGERGFKAVRNGRTIGAVVLAAALRDRDLCPPGTYVIERLWVHPDDVGEHVGTQLVQRACSLLVADRGRILVAYGTDGVPDCAHLPASWLASAGFAEHVDGVQWRIDLRRTLPLAGLARDAAAMASRLVRPRSHPEPAARLQRNKH